MEMEKMIELIDAVSKSDLTGFKYEEDGIKLHLSKKENTCYVTKDFRVSAGRNILFSTCRRCRKLRKSRRQSRKRTDTWNRGSHEADE